MDEYIMICNIVVKCSLFKFGTGPICRTLFQEMIRGIKLSKIELIREFKYIIHEVKYFTEAIKIRNE
jgi:hypothetical protein